MARRNPLPRRSRGPRALGLGAVAVVVALGAALAGAIAPPVGHAEPAPDLARARELYRSAEAAMQDGHYDAAARDYGAAYELSSDPALFYKIGRAHERAGKCDLALVYYERYLREGKPTEQFTALTRERIAACGGDRAGSAAGGSAGSAGSVAGPAAGGDSAASGSGAASARGGGTTAGPGARGSGTTAWPGAGAATRGAGRAGSTAASTGAPGADGSAASPAGQPAAGSGSAAAALIPPTREKVAWLMGGGAIALVTLGGVLAYAARSSENDVRDLYAGFAGQPPAFDAQTRKRYDDLIDEGRRYQHLAWAAFGLAGAAAVGVAILFTVGRGDQPAQRGPAITPVIGPRGAGVSVQF